ncbi:isocitrate/isopropylmalate dehydrogenase family protein [Acanthopleuribacter pedis]|uniref:Isocitrate/isopropylmalate dehydrogenase family protein n=1 Tax=Acanthopleuribacter pedis TaxID=442870 RepID=A0A8J7QJD5_9BACT|nr:isocitrate/isopropylmalate family dehydrogenase [Acanthopleuribacter pedis]MBO1321230.1 isocitrate/isopropylmalate dehydrogenase family protein [Acanthopleuribacter pedis]
MTGRELVVIPGDGIGREVVPAAVRVLHALCPETRVVEADAGWDCFQATGTSVPEATLDLVRQAGAALFGAVSSPSYPVKGYKSAILTLRRALGLYANVRPVRAAVDLQPPRAIDLVVVRENTEGLYVGRELRAGDQAVAERVITREASLRIGRIAARLALQHPSRKLTVVHKANVVPLSDGLFRDSVREAVNAVDENQVLQVDELLVDYAALKLVQQPEAFGVLVAPNLYGDILSDLAAHWCGGLGAAPSINLGDVHALAEPVHGSAPDIAGRGRANPAAAMLSLALLLRGHWGMREEADLLEDAVAFALRSVGGDAGTEVITTAVIEALGRVTSSV